jgi:hypothetical protein
MSTPSSLYAEKIYSEHPLVLWSLDDKLDYIGLISEEQRQIVEPAWTIENATTTSEEQDLSRPFTDSELTKIKVLPIVGNFTEASISSPNIINFNDLQDLGSFSLGVHFYSNSIFLQTVSLGYEYTDPITLENIQTFRVFSGNPLQKWIFLSETFEIPNVNAQIRILVKVKIFEGSSSEEENVFLLNGLTFGQINEEFNAESFGVNTINVPEEISLFHGLECVQAEPYGISYDHGYYIINDNKLTCKNTSIPLVYGSNGVTKLIPNISPQLIIPGKGFLNKKGQHNDYTVEFWARIKSSTKEPFKIFGPIGSTDGLYVENGFLTLVIGNEFASHFVSEWFRPMLIHIRLIKNSASLLINGEEVLSLSFNTLDLMLPDELDSEGRNQDWLYFASSFDVTPVELDCIAIYSYQVPVVVAKRRWVYGQGVPSAEGINSSYAGTTAFIDYPFANYSSNYNYPDFARWDQGSFDNLVTTETALRTPEYSLPEIFIENKTIQNLYDDNKEIQSQESGETIYNKFLSFRPSSSWNSISSYINFTKFNTILNQVDTIYGVFSSDNLSSNETLFKIYNEVNNDHFLINKDGDEIKYSLTTNNTTETLFISEPITANTLFSVGVNLNILLGSNTGNAASFFGNIDSLKVYCAGDASGDFTFTGKIYSIGFSTEKNTKEISQTVDSSGFVLKDYGQELIDHIASYTLLPSISYEKYFLDIGISGYWEDYLPLSYFAKFVKNNQGETFYDIDFLQFNIGYPTIKNLVEKVGETDLYYNTSGEQLKSYISFQRTEDGANSVELFENNKDINSYRVINADIDTEWETTRFEATNNTLIYPPKSLDFNSLAIVYSLEFKSRGILKKPISVNRLQIASQALNDNSFNPVGTRFGIDLFPYKRSGIYYDYKSKNPFSIYKESTPYLYLNENSGIEVRGKINTSENRGLSLPINKELSSKYKISAIQMWIKYDNNEFPTFATELFEINYKNRSIKFNVKANSDFKDRATVFALDENNNEYKGLSFFLNGKNIKQPVLSIGEWTAIGISFTSPLTFDSYLGSLNVTGPALFNNISYYEANSLIEIQTKLTRPWIQVLSDGSETFNWSYWENNFDWDGVLTLGDTEFYNINPADIYKTYIGTNKIIIDDGQGIVYTPEKVKMYTDIEWSSSVSTAV